MRATPETSEYQITPQQNVYVKLNFSVASMSLFTLHWIFTTSFVTCLHMAMILALVFHRCSRRCIF
jgi:hypothetical protein